MPRHDIAEICEIAARLSEDAVTLRGLGFSEAAQFLDLAEAEIDKRVYAALPNGNRVEASPRTHRRVEGKSREIPTH